MPDLKMKRRRTKRMPLSAVSVVYTTMMMEEEQWCAVTIVPRGSTMIVWA